MKPIIKFNSIILSLTTIVIFAGWVSLSDLIIKYPELTIILSGIFSIGVYRMFFLLLSLAVKNWIWFKSLVFGNYFLEGTWVGFFIGNEGKVRYYVETFEQDFESVIIRGKSFNETGYHASWIAETNNIDVKRGTLSYTYNTDAIGNTFINSGIAFFNFERSCLNKAPNSLIGFSSDLYNPRKFKSFEKKISYNTSHDYVGALDTAKEIYTLNKHVF